MHKPLIILKLGTSSITRKAGSINEDLIESVANQFAVLTSHYRLLLVSSGAVGLGIGFMNKFSGKLNERKAAAAIGNPILMNYYAQAFEKKGLKIAQTLCERGHFSDRKKFLQLRSTIETLWQNDIIPVANENDVVSDLELKFSDNDELATLLAIGLGAEKLLIGTSVEGVLDSKGEVVPKIDHFTKEIMGLATHEKSDFGLGGMISKLTFARLATRLGIQVIIFGSYVQNGLILAVKEEVGTVCKAKESSADNRQKWLASSSLVAGRISVDAGAAKALLNRKSLLSVGVVKVLSEFEKGEVIEIVEQGTDWSICIARAKLSSVELNGKIGQVNVEVAHANDIVLI